MYPLKVNTEEKRVSCLGRGWCSWSASWSKRDHLCATHLSFLTRQKNMLISCKEMQRKPTGVNEVPPNC